MASSHQASGCLLPYLPIMICVVHFLAFEMGATLFGNFPPDIWHLSVAISDDIFDLQADSMSSSLHSVSFLGLDPL